VVQSLSWADHELLSAWHARSLSLLYQIPLSPLFLMSYKMKQDPKSEHGRGLLVSQLQDPSGFIISDRDSGRTFWLKVDQARDSPNPASPYPIPISTPKTESQPALLRNPITPAQIHEHRLLTRTIALALLVSIVYFLSQAVKKRLLAQTQRQNRIANGAKERCQEEGLAQEIRHSDPYFTHDPSPELAQSTSLSPGITLWVTAPACVCSTITALSYWFTPVTSNAISVFLDAQLLVAGLLLVFTCLVLSSGPPARVEAKKIGRVNVKEQGRKHVRCQQTQQGHTPKEQHHVSKRPQANAATRGLSNNIEIIEKLNTVQWIPAELAVETDSACQHAQKKRCIKNDKYRVMALREGMTCGVTPTMQRELSKSENMSDNRVLQLKPAVKGFISKLPPVESYNVKKSQVEEFRRSMQWFQSDIPRKRSIGTAATAEERSPTTQHICGAQSLPNYWLPAPFNAKFDQPYQWTRQLRQHAQAICNAQRTKSFCTSPDDGPTASHVVRTNNDSHSRASRDITVSSDAK
jgi:hypothetical protein